jgi:hypothetical protein
MPDSGDFRRMWAAARWILLVLLLVTSGLYIQSLVTDVAAAYTRGEPLVFASQPWQTQDAGGTPTDHFSPGATVYVTADFTVTYAGQLHSELLLVDVTDNRGRRLTPSDGIIAPGRYQTTARVATLPPDTAPGRYKIIGSSRLTGKLRTFTAEWETQSFDVGTPEGAQR